MDITFSCQMCGQHLTVDKSGAGALIDCPKCGTSLVVPKESIEWKVEQKPPMKTAPPQAHNPPPPSPVMTSRSPIWVKKKFMALRIIATLLRVAAALMIIGGVGAAVLALLVPGHGAPSDLIGAAGAVTGIAIISFLSGLVLWASGESIMVFIDIEENTRATRLLLERR